MSSGMESSGGDLIDISALSRIFVAGDIETHALSSVSLTVKRGEYVSIEGPSGSGSQLSGGQQQRVAVARALVGKPLLLLADEPTGNLDTRNGDAVMQLLGELHGDGVTICLVTHSVDYARCARRAIHMIDGTITDDPRDSALGSRGERASFVGANA